MQIDLVTVEFYFNKFVSKFSVTSFEEMNPLPGPSTKRNSLNKTQNLGRKNETFNLNSTFNTSINPTLAEPIVQKGVDFIQRLRVSQGYEEIEPDDLLMIAISTVIGLAKNVDVPKQNLIWTRAYLRGLHAGHLPNIASILQLIEEKIKK